ncbi:MAG: S8 family serine peptidase [Flavobacteriales bacterium]|nr:S8 family serine peptidase [Flavobacteriales bacterium]
MEWNKVMVRNIFLVCFSLAISLQFSAQTYFKFAVFFSDKGNNNPHSISNPSTFLSQRAIDRRLRYNIAVTEQDLPVNPSYIQGVANVSNSISIVNRSRWFNYVMVGTYDSSVVNSIATLPYVAQVKLLYRGAYPQKPEPGKGEQSSGGAKSFFGSIEDLNYGNAKTQTEMIGLDYLHRKGFLGQDMVIAVLDGGFLFVDQMPAFEHLRAANRILGTWDFAANEESVYEDNNHGTYVLSCMAGFIDGKILGTAPLASYWLLRTEDVYTETIVEEYNWVSGAEFADSVGADLINSSLGYTTFDFGVGDHTYADMNGNTSIATKAADIAAAKGILVVNSAGNSGSSAWKYIGAPADGDSVLAVGAIKNNREKAAFSSFGPSADGRIKPNVCAMGQGASVVGIGGEVIAANGTSFSSPIICGAVACLWQKHRQTKSNMDVFRAVEKSSNLFNNPNDGMGYGIPNLGVADMLLSQTPFDQFFENQEIKVYPNPVSDQTFYVDFYAQLTENILIEITNVKGKKLYSQERQVYQKTMNTLVLNIDTKMSAGVYVLIIHTQNKRFSTKFVKS